MFADASRKVVVINGDRVELVECIIAADDDDDDDVGSTGANMNAYALLSNVVAHS